MIVLIIGYGSIAHKHVAAIRKLKPGTIFYALRSSASAEVDDESIKNIHAIGDLAEEPDFIIISNPTHVHIQTLDSILGMKRPVMIEKPLSHALDGIHEIIEKTADNNLLTYVACNLRFHPVIRFLKEQISLKNARINEVNVYCGSYLPDWRPGKNFRALYSSSASKGGGVHLDLIHEIDYLYWLFGQPGSVRATRRNASSLAIDAIDYANYVLAYEQFSVGLVLNYYRRDAKRSIEILFEDTTWYADLLTCNIKDDKGAILFEQPDYSIQDTYVAQMRYFLEAIEFGHKPMNDINESFEVLKIALN